MKPPSLATAVAGLASFARRPAAWVLAPTLFFVAVSCHRIGAPPTDIHDWRQTLMLGVGRAWACGQPAAEPTMEVCGVHPASMAMELPLYAYLGALLGRLSDPWTGARLAVLLGGACAVAGITLVAYDLLARRWTPVGRMVGTLGAGLAVSAGPLPRHWLGALLPDVFAWGAVMLGAGLLALAPPRWRWLVPLSLLVGLGAATKLFAAPFVLVTAFYVARAWAPAGSWRPSTWARWVPALATHGVLAALPAALWYGVHNRAVLLAHPCTIFVTEAASNPLVTLAKLDSQNALRMQVTDAAGPLLGLAVPGLVLLLFTARLRVAPLVAATACVVLLSASLGAHMQVHEYGGLYWAPLTAVAVGASLALLGEGARRLGRVGAIGVVGLAAGTSAAWSCAAVRDRGRLSHSAYFLEAGHDLNQALDENEGVSDNSWENPLLSYFAARRTRVLGRDFAADTCAAPEFDCAATSRDEKPAECWLPRATAHAYFDGVEVHCGLKDPAAAPARMLSQVRAHALRSVDPPLSLAGGGTIVAVDDWTLTGAAGAVVPARHIDLYVEGRFGTPIPLEAAGASLEAKPPEIVRNLTGPAIVVYRALLPPGDDADVRLAPAAGAVLTFPATRHVKPVAWSCVPGSRP